MWSKLRNFVIGKPRNPLSDNTRRSIALIAFFAWIGLGSDGLSSSCYGPEQAFFELGTHTHLAFYLAFATGITVFLISLAYNQVIKLFPNGGGGYKVATELLGPYAGLLSGGALLIDYTMTIAISIASGGDALFSLLPLKYQHYKMIFEAGVLCIMMVLNLRGAKESIKFLMPIFLGFFITHMIMIILGIGMHGKQLPVLIHTTLHRTHMAIASLGLFTVIAIFMRGYSMGAGTYTGIEAVSNNVNMLAEPRVRTGSWTMFYMAVSLSITAAGIILLYLLWHVSAEPGKTLNAIVFSKILMQFPYHHLTLLILLFFEAGILFIAANTGFLGGPAVLANMSMDEWVPRRFAALSSRLVTQNGVMFFGFSALIALLWSDGDVKYLVIFYSMNVFLTFSMSLLGLTKYWFSNQGRIKNWFWQLLFSFIALAVCVGILLTTLVEKFDLGGWITILITGGTVTVCIFIRKHYRRMNILKRKLDQELAVPLPKDDKAAPTIETNQPTGVFLVKGLGAAMHSVLWVERMFPGHFKNFIFISHGEVDIGSFGSDKKLEKLQRDTDRILNYLVSFSYQQGIAAESFSEFGTDSVTDLMRIAEQINRRYSNVVYFASRYVYPKESWWTRILHSDITTIIQKRLHAFGARMLILPLNLKI